MTLLLFNGFPSSTISTLVSVNRPISQSFGPCTSCRKEQQRRTNVLRMVGDSSPTEKVSQHWRGERERQFTDCLSDPEY